MIDVAVRAAQAAGAILAASRPTRVSHKHAVDLLTDVDLRCEAAVREVLEPTGIPVLGEEGGGAEDAATRWVVDPLDGTTNFVHGFPSYVCSVGLEVDGRPELGVIVDPVHGWTWKASRGGGAWCNDERIAVSDTAELGQALLGTGFPYDRRERPDFYLGFVREALLAAQGLRRAGAAANDLAWLAAGKLDGFWEFGLNPWDVTAGIVLIEEAGGRVTDHHGGPVKSHEILASNARLHDALLEMLARAQ